MSKFKKLCALLLVCMLVVTAGMLTVNAQDSEENDSEASTQLVIHYKGDGTVAPYIYYWNSLPTNISVQYPGKAMTKDSSQVGDNWYTYTFDNVTKINMLFTDKDGNQLSKELTRNNSKHSEWWCKNNKWTSYNPDDVISPSDVDMREETIYFVITTRFYDGDTGNNVFCWSHAEANNADTDPEWRGDFKGLADKLDYIKALGFSAIWITPVVTNASGYDYHGYHAMDFSTVDARYESSDFTYQDLIDAAHEKDMKIIQDVVLQHTGNFGESYFCNLFEKDTSADLSSIEDSMIPTDLLLSTYGLSSAEEYWAQTGSVQHQQRLKLMKGIDPEESNAKASKYEEFVTGIEYDKQKSERLFSDDAAFNSKNYYHSGYWRNFNWDDYATQYAQIASDCVDLNTENPDVAEYTVNAYSNYLDMGVDAFRVDTVRHISRLSLNTMYNDQLNSAGGDGFFMFGEVCTRYNDAWYRGMASESAPFYTWDEPDDTYTGKWNWGTDSSAVGENMNLTLDHWIDNYNPGEQPTSNNAFLNGIEYHDPDYSEASGMGVIDFAMHWNFSSASGAYGTAKAYDKYYNDATWNVVYVDSHDYGPGTFNRYEGGTQAWAENMDLMFTFRGIPCLYYGSEIEFQKGVRIDEGLQITLANSGRAYYGDKLEGTVTATDFSEYTASGTVANTLNSTLSQHLMKLNAIRRAIPALQKGQYTNSGSYVSGNMAYIRRYADDSEGIDSLALVTISGGATFKGIPNGKYIDAVTGDTKTVTDHTLTVPSISKSNMRVYVCCADGFTGIDGAIGKTDGLTYLN